MVSSLRAIRPVSSGGFSLWRALALLIVSLVFGGSASAYDKWVPGPWDDAGVNYAPVACGEIDRTRHAIPLPKDPHLGLAAMALAVQEALAYGNAQCTKWQRCATVSWSASGACNVSGPQNGYFNCPIKGEAKYQDYVPSTDSCEGPVRTTTIDAGVSATKACQYKTDGAMFDEASGRCYCANNKLYLPQENRCLPSNDRRVSLPCDTCHGNPIVVGTGSKLQVQPLGWQPWLPLNLTFNSVDALPYDDENAPRYGESVPSALPGLWTVGIERQIFYSGSNNWLINFVRPNGNLITFSGPGSSYIPASPAVNDQAWMPRGWGYFRDADAFVLEEYDRDLGKVGTVQHMGGKKLDYRRASAATADYPRYALLAVEDQDGRRWTFNYVGGVLTGVTDPGNQTVRIDSDANGVKALRWPDGTSRQFVYEDPNPKLLSGYIDEAGVRAGTYRYDAKGRAVSTERALGLDAYTVSWGQGPRYVWNTGVYDPSKNLIWRDLTIVPEQDGKVSYPNGSSETIGMAGTFGLMKWATKTQAGSDGLTRTTTRKFDARMNVVEFNDYNGSRSCMAYAQDRNVELTRVEGLGADTACENVASGALPAGARRISSQWHPLWRVATRTAEPGRITTLVYNGQPDPLSAGAIASCAPSTSTLPNGEPVAVLCKRVEQATTDATGASGFDATIDTAVPARSASWTYGDFGRVLTEKDSRGVTVVTNEYYADTTTDHTKGDLKSSTNALGHKTSFTRYNAYGQPLEMLDVNSISTVYAYDARQRLSVVTSGGVATSYDYWPTGLLKKTSQPDGSAVNYEYDDAGRLKAVFDSQGNRVEYTLDASGNRTQEVAKDPSGTLKRTMSRVFDALGRAQQTTGRE